MMNRLRRSFRESFRRKKKDHIPESSKPHQWEEDEKSVRAGDCSFAVKYLGCVEVFDARGMQVCEEALKILRSSRRKAIKGVLYVTGDGLRVVDDERRGLIVDQTIEKVSFCAPDRYHERGFSYICRDGATRRWMCHGFHAIKDSGERLSHAVGCAFAVCLEKKQKRDREHQNQLAAANQHQQQSSSTSTSSTTTSPFQRNSSFRQSSILERLKDPQVAKPVIEKPPAKPVVNPYAIERPHATPQLLERQGSFRGFSSLSSASPFKRQLSLRLNELPSNLERYNRSSTSLAAGKTSGNIINNNNNTFEFSYNNSTSTASTSATCPLNLVDINKSSAPPHNNAPGTLDDIFSKSNSLTNGNSNHDDSSDLASSSSSHFITSISEMCKELTHGLTLLSNNDDVNSNIESVKQLASSPCSSNASSNYITPFSTTVGSNGVKKNSVDFIPPLIPASGFNLNSNCSLPTATVAPVMSPAITSSSTVTKTTSSTKPATVTPPPLPPIKSPFAANQSRSMNSALDSPISSNGFHQFRRPVPPPPVSTGFSNRPTAQAALVKSSRAGDHSSIPKLASIRSQPFSNTIDLANIFPSSIDDPFDAEWTNVVTKNLSTPKNPSVSSNHKSQRSEAINKVTSCNEPTNKFSTCTSPSSSSSAESCEASHFIPSTMTTSYDSGIMSPSILPPASLTSTNPFTAPAAAKVNEATGFRKEFQIEM